MTQDIKAKIEGANAEAVNRINAADPILVDIAPAGEVIPGLKDKMILHSGPPVNWEKMSGGQRGAMIGMVLFEGWADTEDEATNLLEGGEIIFEPCHHHQTVGSMAGTITKSLWVFVIENGAFGNRAFSRQVQDSQQFGDYSQEALQDLVRFGEIWGPSLRAGLRQMGGLRLKPIITRALQMGDELHNRNNAATSLWINSMIAPMIKAGVDEDALLSTLTYLTDHELLFLGVGMGAAKSILDPAHGIEYSTVVTAMARNGTEFGIRVSGLGDEWFTGPSPRVKGLFMPGYSDEDAGLDMGDSAITETVGWGGFALAGSPAVLSYIGGMSEEAQTYDREMREITVTTSPDYLIPALGFEGTPVGIDIRKVIQTNIPPAISTGIAHKEPGYPIIGAGIARPPLECFEKALVRFGEVFG